MAMDKRSLFIPMDGGLSDGDTEVVSIDAPSNTVLRNFSTRNDGSIEVSRPVDIVAVVDGASKSSAIAYDNGVLLVTGNSANFVGDDGTTSDVPIKSAGALSMVATPISFGGQSSSVQPSMAELNGSSMVSSWDYRLNRVKSTLNRANGLSVVIDMPDGSYCPTTIVQNNLSGIEFTVVCKIDNGPLTSHDLCVTRISADGVVINQDTITTLTGGLSPVYRNGLVACACGVATRVVVFYTTASGGVYYAIIDSSTGSIVLNSGISSTGNILNCLGDETSNRIYVVSSPSAIAGRPYVHCYNRTTGTFVAFTQLPELDTEHATVGFRPSYNVCGMTLNTESSVNFLYVLLSSIERGPLKFGSNEADAPYDVNFGDMRSFPDDLAAADLFAVINTSLRNYTVAHKLPTDLSSAVSGVIGGVGVLGNGVVKDGRSVFPFEWGFPASKDNAGPSSGGLTFSGKPMPATGDVSSPFALPFDNDTKKRPSWWRPTLSASGKYPDPQEAISLVLGGSLLEQEGQAHYNHVSQNAIIAQQEGRVGVLMSVVIPEAGVVTTNLQAVFLSNSISSRSNYAPYRLFGQTASTWSNSLMSNGRLETPAAQSQPNAGLTISPCNLVTTDNGFGGAFVVADQQSYFQRNIVRCDFSDSIVQSPSSQSMIGSAVCIGGIACAVDSVGVVGSVIPRPPQLFTINPEVDNDNYHYPVADETHNDNVIPLIQRSSYQGDPSCVTEFGFLYVRYKVKVGSRYAVGQLSPPLMIRTENNSVNSWKTSTSPDRFLSLYRDTLLAAHYNYHPMFGPTARATINVGSEDDDYRIMHNPFFVPSIPWIDDDDIELDLYIDDYGTSLGEATEGTTTIGPVTISGGYVVTTFSLSGGRIPNGQPRYIATVKPKRILAGVGDRSGSWLGFYFGHVDVDYPESHESGSISPTGGFGAAEPIAADALEASPATAPHFKTIGLYNGRLLGVSADRPTEVWVSKPPVAGTVPQFSDELVFRAPDDGDSVVAVSALEERLIVFRERSILQSASDLPDATGSGGPSELSPLTSDVGCISPNSIATTPLGVVFEGQKGFCLVTPGGSVEYISKNISNLCGSRSAQNCTSSCVDQKNSEAIFCMCTDAETGPYVLVWNYRTNKWATLHSIVPIRSIANSNGSVWGVGIELDDGVETGDAGAMRFDPSSPSGSSLTPSIASSAWIKPNGKSGYGRVTKCQVLGKASAGTMAASITCRTYVDYSTTADTEVTFQIASLLDDSNQFSAIMHPKTQKAKAFRFEFEIDTENEVETIATSATISLLGIQLDIGQKRGSFKNVVSSSKG